LVSGIRNASAIITVGKHLEHQDRIRMRAPGSWGKKSASKTQLQPLAGDAVPHAVDVLVFHSQPAVDEGPLRTRPVRRWGDLVGQVVIRTIRARFARVGERSVTNARNWDTRG